MNGKIVAICTSSEKGVVKTPVDQAELRIDHGIVGDAHAGNWHRQISLLATDSIAQMKVVLPDLADGAFAENIVISGLELKNLPIGTKLRLGTTVLELTQIGKECHQGCAIREATGDCVMPREGVFCRVLEGGVIQPGQDVTVLNSFIPGSHQRKINYLRLSVTDRCNQRCSYCMPAEGIPVLDRAELLSRADIMTIARTVVGLGIRKIRVTGGEPLVRPDIVELLTELGTLANLERLVLTTNGQRLGPIAAKLRDVGVSGVNISIDSLNADRYREITRGGNLKKCLAGIEAAIAAGLKTKLNVVVMAGMNDQEAPAFVDFARANPVSVRFIEYMPTQGSGHDQNLTVPTAELIDRLRQEVTLEPIQRSGGLTIAGPARNFRIPGAKGTVGVISPVTCHFCADCNRLRITANGLARGCLFHDSGLDLKPWLRAGDEQGLAQAIRQVVNDKPTGHSLDEDKGPGQVAMSQVGG